MSTRKFVGTYASIVWGTAYGVEIIEIFIDNVNRLVFVTWSLQR